ncbi:endonuclease/exonuclease/phosphatase family protein [Parafilimonas sp.]|uniref:endonuclease/exonuclease/phosphatase family protein n=1 Tax=Parafilimonas sp. TaxID=1969739 RepID=UPI0039E42656
MKKTIRFVWVCGCIALTALFLVSCFSAYVSPFRFSFMPLFALWFPYWFLGIIIAGIINLFMKNKLGYIMLASLLPGLPNIFKTVAFNLPASFNINRKDSGLRILTWNVQGFVTSNPHENKWPYILQVVKNNKPDVVCMQEFLNTITNPDKNRYILDEMKDMGYAYHFFSNDNFFRLYNGVRVVDGCAIFSKTPFTDSGRITITTWPEKQNLVYAGLELHHKPFRVLTARLESFRLYNDTTNKNQDIYEITYHRKRTIQYKLRDVEKLHAKEAAIIRNEINRAQMPVIYCGDMNSVPTSYTYHTLRGNLNDAFLEKGPGIGRTFYKILPTLRIDYIFTDKRFRVFQTTVINKKLSDHYPVITDIDWK